MATNIRQGGINNPIIHVGMKVTVPATNTTTVVPKSGTACLAGSVPGIAVGDVDTVTSITVLNTNCIAEVSVKGIGASGNAAISARDLLYMQTDGTIDKNSGGSGAKAFGTAFGNALTGATGTDTRDGQLVASAATTTIRVWVGKVN